MVGKFGVFSRHHPVKVALGFPFRLVVLLLFFCGLAFADPCTEDNTKLCQDLCPAGLFKECDRPGFPDATLCSCYKMDDPPRAAASVSCESTPSGVNSIGNPCERAKEFNSQFTVYKCMAPTDLICVQFTGEDPPTTTTEASKFPDIFGIIVFIANTVLVIVRTVVGTIKQLIVTILPIVNDLFSFIAQALTGVVDSLSL